MEPMPGASGSRRMVIDCVIIGGGPAGLAGAVYLARFHRAVVVFDRGGSRAALIPTSHNLAGFPDGLPGPALLERMRAHAAKYGAEFRTGNITEITRVELGWLLRGDGIDLVARTVLFSTGVDNRRPAEIGRQAEAAALAAGTLRYCAICDGYEAGGPDRTARVGVIGADSHGVAEALFLRGFTQDVTLFSSTARELNETDRAALAAAGVNWEPRPVAHYEFGPATVRLVYAGGGEAQVDTIYPALGSVPNTELIDRLGLRRDEDGCLVVDRHQRLGLEGLYAAGDVTAGLDQIAVATGQAALAATTIHNDLRERDGATATR